MSSGGFVRLRRVGPLLAAGALTVVGIAGCASGDGSSRDGASAKAGGSGQVASRQAGPAAPKSGGESAASGAAYCRAVETFDGMLRGVPTGDLTKVQDSLDEVSAQMRSIAAAAPKQVAKDWEKLRSGFDRLNDSYELLDGISGKALQKLQSAGSDQVTATDLQPQQVKQYEKFRKKAESISSAVESSGKKVSRQTEKKCGITIGE